MNKSEREFELCASAKLGRKCPDDICRGNEITLCGFDEEAHQSELAYALEQNGPPSPCCGAGMCEHGVCDNFCNNAGEPCAECVRRSNLNDDADREADYQRDVIGPMFGFGGMQ